MNDQDFFKIKKDCEESEFPFVDPNFLPEEKSLCEDPVEYKESWNQFIWIRANDIPSLRQQYGKLHLFYGGISPSDIRQGRLGDCYFLCTLSVLSENPHRIMQMFLSDDVNAQGVFGVSITKNGLRMKVVLDDFIPCTGDGFPAFT